VPPTSSSFVINVSTPAIQAPTTQQLNDHVLSKSDQIVFCRYG